MSTVYTCPMHPEIKRNEPGSCPICGMSLELVTSSVDVVHRQLRRLEGQMRA
jgi:hypothetical protein